MNRQKSFAILVLGVALTMGATAEASAAPVTHPRRAEVIGRLHHQTRRINQERREGELTAGQAHRLHADDRAIFHQEKFDARLDGGHITKAEQHGLNQEENTVSNRIGK